MRTIWVLEWLRWQAVACPLTGLSLKAIEWLFIPICLGLTHAGSTAILQINGKEEEVEVAD